MSMRDPALPDARGGSAETPPPATPFAVAAVIPAHDGLPDVLEAVASALAQTLPPVEVIVVDDDSHDGTALVVRERFGPRVHIVRGRFGSAAAARNAGWRAARAPWVAFLDADDIWFPDKLATAAATLAVHPAASWFFSDGTFRTLEGRLEPSWVARCGALEPHYMGRPVAQLIQVNFILTSSVVVSRALLDAERGFDERLTHAEDLDLWIRLARRATVAGAQRALVRYQHRPGGLTRDTERRLEADRMVLGRLARDRTLPARERSLARRRLGLESLKLSLAALREGRRAEARRRLASAWRAPDRWGVAALAWAASWLPPAVFAALKRGRSRAGAWLVRGPRVVVDGDGA